MHFVKIKNQTNSTVPELQAEYCYSFIQKFKGLMFRQTLEPNQALVLAENSESIINTTIHMMFMKFDIGVLWLDQNKRVVDTRHAFPWKLAYSSKTPAKYVIELHPTQLPSHKIGDQLTFEDA